MSSKYIKSASRKLPSGRISEYYTTYTHPILKLCGWSDKGFDLCTTSVDVSIEDKYEEAIFKIKEFDEICEEYEKSGNDISIIDLIVQLEPEVLEQKFQLYK